MVETQDLPSQSIEGKFQKPTDPNINVLPNVSKRNTFLLLAIVIIVLLIVAGIKFLKSPQRILICPALNNVYACNSVPGCAWYFCANKCRPQGTSTADTCPHQTSYCQTFTSEYTCQNHAQEACVWSGCYQQCVAEGYHSDLRCQPTSTPAPKACQLNSKGDLNTILDTYIVQKDDSLSSISNKKLGSPSRYQEIAFMNGDKFPVMFSSPGVVSRNAFLEEGWKLLLPPSWIKNSSGQLDIVNGMIFDIDQNGLKVTTGMDKSGWFATLITDKNSINTDNTAFNIGDCITVVRDIGLNRVIKIDLQ